jgi:hypothetical protein
MDHAEQLLLALGCPKVALQIRRENAGLVAFYSRLGYTEDDVISMGKRLDEPSVVRERDAADENDF